MPNIEKEDMNWKNLFKWKIEDDSENQVKW